MRSYHLQRYEIGPIWIKEVGGTSGSIEYFSFEKYFRFHIHNIFEYF